MRQRQKKELKLITSEVSPNVSYKFKTKVNIALLLLVIIRRQMFSIFLACEEKALMNHTASGQSRNHETNLPKISQNKNLLCVFKSAFLT